MTWPFLPVLCATVLCCTVSMAVADPHKDESGKGRKHRHHASEKHWKDHKHQDKHKHKHQKQARRDGDAKRSSYFHDHGYTRLHIPPGHYPPPGQCRLWYPERPPGHQPPPGNCYPVPRGAWLVRHPRDHPGRVQVTVYEPRRPGTVISIGEFAIDSGALLRVLLEN